MSNFHLSRESRDKNSRSILAAFRKIHEMKAKSLFSLGGAVLVLPLLAQGAEAAASLGGIEGVAGFRVLEDGSVEVVLNSGATVVVDASNVESIDGNQVIVSDVAVAELSSLAAGNGAVAGAFGNAGAAVGGLLGLGLAVGGGGGGGGGGGSTAISKTLSVIDAPLENALVFYDSNSDGNPDQSEFLGLTNAQGGIDVNYTPVDGGKFIIIPSPVVDASIYGWDSAFAATYAPDAANPIITRDVVTDNSFTQVLLANDTGAGTDQVVSPVSTLVSSGMDEAVLKQVLGLPAETDLNTLNFFEDLSSGDSAAQEAASKVAGFAAAMAKVVDAAVSAASSSGTLTEAELQQITQDAFADAGKVLAVATEGGVSLEDALEAASAVAVAGAISDGVNTDDMAAEIIAAAGGGASIDDAITTAVTTQATAGNLTSDQVDGVEEISEAVATASTAIIEIFEDAVIPTGATLDDIEELLKTSLDDATDAADAAINDAVNEQLLGVKLEADSNEATEGQVAILKGNVLANDLNEDGTALDSNTRVDSVNGLDMAEGGTTDGTSSSFVISTRDWATPERTVSVQSIDDAMGLNGVFPEARPFGSPTRGSAVIAEITVGAGDTISYDYIFASYDYIPYNDYSFFAVQNVAGGAGVVLRGETGESTAGPADVRDLKGPGYYVNAGVETNTSKSFSYTFTEAGTYKIAIGVTDVRDTIVDSKISVSNIELTPNGGTAQPVTGFTEHGNVQAEAPTVTALSETLLTGFYGTLIINETGDYIYQVGGPNAEPIAEGEVVTDNFDYTVKLPDGTLATQTLSIKVTGTADAAVDAPTILLDVSPINGADMTAAVFAGSTTNAVGETIVLTISDQDPTTSDIIISDIVVDSDGNFVTTQDVSGLTDGELSVTATVNTTNGSASSTAQAELDRTADEGGDYALTYSPAVDGITTIDVTGLDADALLTITATDGVVTETFEIAANGTGYSFDVSALNPALTWTGSAIIVDNLGNEQTFPAETVYQPQVSVDITGGVINQLEANSVLILGTSTVPNGIVTLDVGGIVVSGVTTGADGSFSATVDVSGLPNDGQITASASVTFGGVTTAPATDTATLDRTADADTPATMKIVAIGPDVLVTIAGLDDDATAQVTLNDVFLGAAGNGSFTVTGANTGSVLSGHLNISDAAGNSALVFADPGFAPTINLVIPTVTAANAGSVEITGTTTATVGTMQLTISDADGATVDVMPAAVTVAADGTFTVTGIDLSGQVDGALTVTAVQTYEGLTSSSDDAGVKDTDAGSVTVTPSGFAIVAGEAMVNIDVSNLEPGASVVVSMTAPGEAPVSVTANANGTVSVPLGGADGGETLSFSYVLTDPVGNTASGTAPDAIAPRVINTDTGEGFQTLQAAIDAAADGETLQMDSGQFNEDVTVDKQLTIKGAQADVSAKFTPGQLDPNMDGSPRGDETEILGTVTIASDDVTLNGLALEDPDEPLTWDESLLAGNPGALDNFTMINTIIEGFKASGSPTFNAGSTATRGSYDGPAVADGWVIENNFIGGVTEGNGGALYLSGLSNASISDNMFWRPAAGHMYVSSLTDIEIDGNFFYHGVHAGGADFDGFGDEFSGNGYGYGYGYGAGGAPSDPFFGRNFWIEMKGDNDGVMITGNDGQFNSGGIQLYGQDLAYDFDNITISGNTFRDFVNADPFGVLEGNGKSGFMGAINVAGLDGSQVENLVITGNTITGNADQIYSDRDVFSLIVLQGDIVGAVIDDNILTWDTSSTDITTVLQTLGAPTSLFDGGLGAIGMSGGLSGVINIEGNTFSESVPSGPGEPGQVIGVLVFASDASGTFQAELTEVGNDFSGWTDPNALDLVFVNIPEGYTPPEISLETPDTFVFAGGVLIPLRLGDDTANTLTGTGNNELFFGAGGDDAISLGGGQDIVVVDPSDPAANGTDTITGFDTGAFGSGNPDGIFFASLSQGDLRGDGSGSQKIDDVSDAINVNAGLLIFDNSMSAADVTTVLTSLGGDSVLFATSDGANTEIGLWDGSSTSDLAVLNGIANPSDLDSSQFLQFATLPEV